MGCKRVLLCLLAGVLIIMLPLAVSADMGPKPAITIIVENPPQGEYYLDLLVNSNHSYSNLSDEERAKSDPVKLNLLETYDKDGWYAGLAHGTGAPLFGSLTGEMDNGRMVHRFSYFGIPDRYKVIIVTPDNHIKISEELTRVAFQEIIVIDYNNMATYKQNVATAYVRQFALTFFPTILIEGILLLLFGFSLRKNWLVFLGVNLATQVAMTAILGSILINSGLIASLFAFIPVEIGIIVVEVLVFARLLKGHSRGRRIWYAVAANIASAVAGFLLMPNVFTMIFG